jgi:hypothetical protein
MPEDYMRAQKHAIDTAISSTVDDVEALATIGTLGIRDTGTVKHCMLSLDEHTIISVTCTDTSKYTSVSKSAGNETMTIQTQTTICIISQHFLPGTAALTVACRR